MGRGYRSIEPKTEGLALYRFTVVIENSREEFCVTEKPVDALRCRCVPIYWGAPDVAAISDGAVICCASLDEIMDALRRLTPEDYEQRREAIERHARLADHFANMHQRAASAVLGRD